MDEIVGSGTEDRPCCDSQFNTWHGRPCTVNGPTGPVGCHPLVERGQWSGKVTEAEAEAQRRAETARAWQEGPKPMEFEGRVLLGDPEGVRRRHPEVFMGVDGNENGKLSALQAGFDFGYYRTCCSTAPGSPHWQGCRTNFFVEGQTVVKPDLRGLAYPWDRAPLRIREDTVSSDRTFENETRLNPRPKRKPRPGDDWMF